MVDRPCRGDFTMNIFFGPAGRQFDSYEARVAHYDQTLQHELARLSQQPVEVVLDRLGDIYLAGLHAGIRAGYIDHRVRQVHGDIVTHVTAVERCAAACDQELSAHIIHDINNYDSVAFSEMDTLINDVVVAGNELVAAEDIELLDQLFVDDEMAFEIFIGAWQHGYQNYLYQVWQLVRPNYEDGRRYRNATRKTQEIVKEMQLTDFDCPNTRLFVCDWVLDALDEQPVALESQYDALWHVPGSPKPHRTDYYNGW